MHLNHPQTISTSCPGPLEKCLSQNSSLVSKMLGNTGLYDPNILKREREKEKKKLSEIIFGWWIVSDSLYIYLFQIFYMHYFHK